MTEVMTTEEAARYLRTSVDSVKRLARCGGLPAAKLGRAWRFRKADLDLWLSVGGTMSEARVDAGLVAATEAAAADPANEPSVSWEAVKAALGL